MNKPTALVIGDIALDRRTEGSSSKMSREAPVPVLLQDNIIESLGWAGNVAANIKALGHEVMLMGTIGGWPSRDQDTDAAGYRIIELAQDLGIQTCLPSVTTKPTTVKHRTTCNGVIMSRVDTQDGPMSNDDKLIQGLHSLAPFAANIKVIVISDNGNGTVSGPLLAAIREFAKQFNIPIFVDCRWHSPDVYYDVTLLKPNMADALGMLQDNVHPGLAVEHDPITLQGVACHELQRKYRTQLVVVTNGEHGCAYTDGSDVKHYDCFGGASYNMVRDICGAGDTVMAALAVGVLEQIEFSKAVLFSMQCASYVVQFHGIHLADRDAVEDFIYDQSGWSRKCMSQEQAVAFVERKRRLNPNQRIVLANGCFDGMHAGHLETFRFGKTRGECLVVAYNDDESVRQIKGQHRPQVPDSYRMSHLAMLEPVDAVMRFNGDVEALVRLLKPDVLVKGADAKDQYINLPGADYVASYGGDVAYCPIDTFYLVLDRNRPAHEL